MIQRLGTREKAYTDYESSTYTVVSKVAYLIGVQKRIFENEYEPPKMEWYEKLHADKNARIVRNLCMIRTALELNFKAINKPYAFRYVQSPLASRVCSAG